MDNQASETFRNIPQASEEFGKLPNASEKTENHTLTVREVARMFEEADVARTERSIVNWCTPNRQGITRLDCYYDNNERKYLITPQSVARAISEEEAKRQKRGRAEAIENVSLPKASEKERTPRKEKDVEELGYQIVDLKIANRGKDLIIDHLKSERNILLKEALQHSRKIGELETMLQLQEPKEKERHNVIDMESEDDVTQ